jgi:putative ABC transport system ATP-binding protein
MIKLIDISKTFNPGTITEKRAVKRTNLALAEGDFVTVIGGNGAGKSTLLNLIAGVYEADTGAVMLDGVDVTKKKEHERAAYLGRVFQDPMMGTAANMEIVENLALAYRRGKRRRLKWGVTRQESELYIKRLAMLDLGLETRLHSRVGLLSGGQRQALTLLMATLQKPKLLLLDEHTAALDPKTAAKVLDLTERFINDEGLTAFMVTHNMRHAIKYGNRLIMMADGSIIYEVSGAEKQSLEVSDLLKKFEQVSGVVSDRMILN